MLDHKKIAEMCFDHSVRLESIIHLASMAVDYSFADPAKEFFEMQPEKAEKLLGIEIDEDPDWEELASKIYRAGKLGFIVQVSTPVPRDFDESGSHSTSGWGFYTSEWLYTEAIDDAFFAEVEKWRDAYIEKCKQAELSKK